MAEDLDPHGLGVVFEEVGMSAKGVEDLIAAKLLRTFRLGQLSGSTDEPFQGVLMSRGFQVWSC